LINGDKIYSMYKKMKKQITALVTYISESRHLVCFNEINVYSSFSGKIIFISGYVIDSETLSIGTPMSQMIIEFKCDGLLENKSYHGLNQCKDIEVIEVEYYPNWFDKLVKFIL